MLGQSFFPNFGQGPFPKIAGKGPAVNVFDQERLQSKSLYFIDMVLNYDGKKCEIHTRHGKISDQIRMKFSAFT